MSVYFTLNYKNKLKYTKEDAACYSSLLKPNALENVESIFVYNIWDSYNLNENKVAKFLSIITSIKYIKPLLSEKQIQDIINNKTCTFELKKYKNGIQLLYILSLVRLLTEYVGEVNQLCKLKTIKHRFSNLYFLCLVLSHRISIGHNPHLPLPLESFENKNTFYREFVSNTNFKLFKTKKSIKELTPKLHRVTSFNSTYDYFNCSKLYYNQRAYKEMLETYGGGYFEK